MIRYPGKRTLRRVVTAMSLAMVPATALAYLDPSTGSMLVSAIILEKKQGQPPKEKAVARLQRSKSFRVSPALNGVAISGRF